MIGGNKRQLAALAALACILMLPSLLAPPFLTDSQQYNKFWMAAFHRELAAGHVYPRWLHQSWQGLGSPTFYFYPPAYFYLTSAVRAASANLLSWHQVSTIVQALVIFASGLAMRHWLRGIGSERAALIGACAYMAAPYHLNDFYMRGALAESLSYALIPLLATELRRLSRNAPGAVPLLALVFALLLLSHLPVALLVSVTMLPAYALFLQHETRRSGPAFLLRTGFGLGLGLLLAAVYLLPSLALLPWVASDALWTRFFSPAPWFFWNPATWPSMRRMLFTVVLATGLLALAGSVLGRPDRTGRGEALLWAAVAGLCFVLISGALPVLWEVPILAKVQFPWRALPIMEFASLTAIVACARPRTVTLGFGLFMTGAAFLLGAFMATQAPSDPPGDPGVDAVEYLPRGYPLPLDAGRPTRPERVTLPPAAPGVAREPLLLVSHGPGVAAAPRFYFPAWTVVDQATGRAAEAFPCTRYRLLCWRTPAGVVRWRVAIAPLAIERIGAAASSLALLVILLLWWRARRDSTFPDGRA